MKAITFVVPGCVCQRTGGTIYDAAIIDALREAGWQIDVVELAGRFPWPDARTHAALEQELSALADGALVVIDALAAGGLPAAIERHAARLRLVLLVHHPLADETGLSAETAADLLARERRVLACAERIIVTSAFTAQRLRALGLGDQAAVVVEPGVAPAALARGSAGAACRLLCVATITPRKGHLTLVEALSQLGDLDWICDCVGEEHRDPRHSERVRQAIAGADLDARIRLHGALGESALDGYYQQADIFVLASHYEGYGMVITEAIARGLPVVTTTGGALGRTLPAGAGVAVEPGDAGALAAALAGMIADGAQRARGAAVARNAREHLRSWRAAGAEFARALESCTDRASNT